MASGRPPWDGARSAGTLIQFLILLLCFYALTRLGLAAAVNLSSFHIDGAYQTASGLFRLQAEELPGRDFFPYLGTGVLLSLYPAFLAFGGDLAASTASSHLMVALSQAVSVAVILFLCVGPRVRLLWIFSLSMLLVALALLLNDLPPLLAERMDPGNSLRPLRSALPYIAALPVYMALARRSVTSFAVLGLIAGAAMIWSNDFALPVAFHCGLAALGLMVIGRNIRYCLKGAALFTAAFLFGLLPLLLATGGHLAPLLAFNFMDVAGDQWWYFGPWVESCRLFSVTDLPQLISRDNLIGLIALVAVAVSAWIKRSPESFTLLWLGSTLLLGGTLASVGGHFGGYFAPFQFWGFLVAMGVVIRLGLGWIVRTEPPRAGASVLLVVGLGLGSYLAYAGHLIHQQTITAAQEHDQLYVPELGGFLPPDWEEYVELARNHPRDESVLEEYWGIWSAISRSQPLLPVDSAIHALGSVREQAIKVMAQAPDTLITTLPAHSAWQSWSLSTNYWLYRPLLLGYSPIATSPHTVVWRRTDETSPALLETCEVDPDGSSVTVTVAKRGYLELELDHNPVHGGRRITMLRTAIPHAAGADGWQSLAPGTRTTLVPAYADEPGAHRYETRLIPDDGSKALQIHSCAFRRIESQMPQALKNLDVPFPITDARWTNGVSRDRTALLVASSPDNFARLVPGAIVEFEMGERREVVDAIDTGPWLEVLLDGSLLNASSMGFPRRFEVEHPEGVARRKGAPRRLEQASMACIHPDQR